MRPDEVPVVEAAPPLAFMDDCKLEEHVVKHVLECRESEWADTPEPMRKRQTPEGWDKTIGHELVRTARRQYRQGIYGPTLKEVKIAYEKILADALVRACRLGHWHWHMASQTLSAANELEAPAALVDAWPPDEALMVSAISFVRNGRLGPYRLLTGYRPWPKLGRKAFETKAKERAKQRSRLRALHLIAKHE